MQASPLVPWNAARQMLDSGEYQDALDCLAGAMTDPQAPVGVWVMAARAWWCIAQGGGDWRAYEKAAQAMERIQEQEPDNDDLWSRMGTCRVLQAAGERGASRIVTLDIAIANLRRAVEVEAAPDKTLLDTLGHALLQRAQATGSRATVADLLEEAVSTLQSATRATNDASSPSAWLLQQALQAQAATLPRADAAKLRMEIDALLRAGQHAASDEGRARWYVARVENELAHAELAEGATRALHLRALRAAHHPALTGADAPSAYLLCWLRIVLAEIAYVRGEAVAARFEEAMAIMRRLEATGPGDPDIAHARARLLRRRATHATGNARLSMLRDALQGLMPFADREGLPALQLEIAELMLEQAVASPLEQGSTQLARVIDVATPLLDVAEQAIPALCCIIQAQLASGGQANEELCERLCAMAPHDPRACAVLARAALRDGKPEQACGYCESAVRYNDGRAETALLQLWHQASQQWNESLPPAGRRDWQVNHQHLRAAG